MTMYVRFGAAPESGFSMNAETGVAEAGVSCYRAEWQSTDRDVICLIVPNNESATTAAMLEDRPLYLIKGTPAGIGSDGEPLLTDVTCTPLDGVEIINYVVDGDE